MNSGKRNGLETLAHGAFRDGRTLGFAEQLDEYAYGTMPSGSMFLVAESSLLAGVTECPDLPILMRKSVVDKVACEHEIPLREMAELPNWLRSYPLAMESITQPNSIVIITSDFDSHGNEILVALHLNQERRGLEINEVASIYGKRNLAYLIENTIRAGKCVFINKRTGDWYRRAGLPLPERVASHLSAQIEAFEASHVNACIEDTSCDFLESLFPDVCLSLDTDCSDDAR